MNDFLMKKVTPLEKVFPHKEPTSEGMEERITALKGETVSFQVAYWWYGNGKAFGQVEIQSPIREYVRIRCVKLVPCEYPTHPGADEDYLFKAPGLAPDLLTDISVWGIDMIGGQWRSLWIDLEVPEDLDAGVYPVSVQIKKDGEIRGNVAVELEVIDAQLPVLPIPRTEWFHTDCIANYYGVEPFSEEYWKITENFVKAAVKRKCNMLLTPVFTPPLDTEVGGERRTIQLVDVTINKNGYEFGYEKFEHWVEMCKRCGIVYYEISHLFTQWGASNAPKIVGTKEGKEERLFGWETDASGEEYRDFLHQFLQSFRGELEKLGISKATYFHVSDEPGFEHLVSYQAAKRGVEKELQGFQMIDALSDYKFYEEGLVPQPVCALNHMKPFLENRPEKLWGYYCTSQFKDVPNRFIAQPGYRTRILGLLMYKYRLDGFLHWGYNFYNTGGSRASIDPYRTTDAAGAVPSGDPFLVYPGKDGIPEESIRMMLMDEAMSDLGAMYCLEEMAGRGAVLECIPGEEKIDFEHYPRNIQYLMQMRNEINMRIKAEMKKLRG